jgi:hypothetical protein
VRLGSSAGAGASSAREDVLLVLRPSRQDAKLLRPPAALRSSPSVVIPSSSRSFSRSSAQDRGGAEEDDLAGISALRRVSAWISPSWTISTIFSSIVLPIPCSSFARLRARARRPARRLAHARRRRR